MNLRRAYSFVELLIVIAIIGILIGLLIPAIQAVRQAGYQTESRNNLKQIALASHMYFASTGAMPGYNGPEPGVGNPFYWMLPYIDQQNLYDQSKTLPSERVMTVALNGNNYVIQEQTQPLQSIVLSSPASFSSSVPIYTGEAVVYTTGGTPYSGISQGQQYYVGGIVLDNVLGGASYHPGDYVHAGYFSLSGCSIDASKATGNQIFAPAPMRQASTVSGIVKTYVAPMDPSLGAANGTSAPLSYLWNVNSGTPDIASTSTTFLLAEGYSNCTEIQQIQWYYINANQPYVKYVSVTSRDGWNSDGFYRLDYKNSVDLGQAYLGLIGQSGTIGDGIPSLGFTYNDSTSVPFGTNTFQKKPRFDVGYYLLEHDHYGGHNGNPTDDKADVGCRVDRAQTYLVDGKLNAAMLDGSVHTVSSWSDVFSPDF